ncbi:unnamed protein product [Rotaria sp. Silwood2]|nr:unnamed protein product [Rotaria sp. Silwood2]
MDILLRLISTQPLFDILRIQTGNSHFNAHAPVSMSNLSIQMTVLQMMTSSNVMPIFRRANVSLFINTNDLNCISPLPLFTDHRHVDVHFTFNFINCPQYIKVTQ